MQNLVTVELLGAFPHIGGIYITFRCYPNIFLQNPQIGPNRHFSAKSAKSQNSHISVADEDLRVKFVTLTKNGMHPGVTWGQNPSF